MMSTTDVNVVAARVFDYIKCAERFNGRAISVIIINGVVWFKGKDVAVILDYADTIRPYAPVSIQMIK